MPCANVAISTSGDNTIVAAPGANQFIRVFNWRLSSNGTTNLTWKSGASTNLDGPYYANQFFNTEVDSATEPVFDCAAGQALVLNNSQAIAVGGAVNYAVYGPQP